MTWSSSPRATRSWSPTGHRLPRLKNSSSASRRRAIRRRLSIGAIIGLGLLSEHRPGVALSGQTHRGAAVFPYKSTHRAEHWVVVRGAAEVTLNGKTEMGTRTNRSTCRSARCTGLPTPGKIDLELIEVQTGSYLGEDDILRIEDDFNRMWSNTELSSADWTGNVVMFLSPGPIRDVVYPTQQNNVGRVWLRLVFGRQGQRLSDNLRVAVDASRRFRRSPCPNMGTRDSQPIANAKHFMGLAGDLPPRCQPIPGDDGSNDRLFRAVLSPSFDLRGSQARLRKKSVGIRRAPRVALP
jgi:hypothetical protein